MRTKVVDKALVSAAERAGVDQFWVLRSLRRNATLAARAGDRSAANRAVELIGKHLNMFVDSKSVEINYIDDSDAYLAQLMEIVQGRTIEHEQLPQPADSVGSDDGSDADI